jgi:hypothetical protein
VSVVKNVFEPIYGKPSWQVEQGYGSFLTFEFGEPHLHIREPRQATEQATEGVRKNAARRFVYVHGDWHLWIHVCDWHIFLQGQELANHASSRRTIKKATIELNGQALTQVTIKDSFVSVFEFDLGGRLEVIPNYVDYKKDVDLWLLYEPSGKVFTLRADGQYCHMPGDISSDKGKWKPLVIPKPKNVA